MEQIAKEDYAKVWFTTEPDKDLAKFGTRKQMQFAEFLSRHGCTQEGWDYWMDRLNSTDPIERQFVKQLVKYRFQTRKGIVMTEMMKNVKIEAHESAIS